MIKKFIKDFKSEYLYETIEVYSQLCYYSLLFFYCFYICILKYQVYVLEKRKNGNNRYLDEIIKKFSKITESGVYSQLLEAIKRSKKNKLVFRDIIRIIFCSQKR